MWQTWKWWWRTSNVNIQMHLMTKKIKMNPFTKSFQTWEVYKISTSMSEDVSLPVLASLAASITLLTRICFCFFLILFQNTMNVLLWGRGKDASSLIYEFWLPPWYLQTLLIDNCIYVWTPRYSWNSADLWIVHSWLSLRFSLMFIHGASVSGLSILDCPFGFL
jgi:hypothetical protein